MLPFTRSPLIPWAFCRIMNPKVWKGSAEGSYDSRVDSIPKSVSVGCWRKYSLPLSK